MYEMYNPQSPGAWIMYVITALSVVAVVFIVERFLALSAARTNLKRFQPEFEERVGKAQIEEARELCRAQKGVIPQVLDFALGQVELTPDDLRQILADEIHMGVLPRLEKNLGVMATIGRGAPMLGLLGTVMGMIELFATIQHKTDFNVSDIAGGIFTALGTTAAGLMVAIPILFFHSYFKASVLQIERDLHKTLSALLRLLRRREGAPRAR